MLLAVTFRAIAISNARFTPIRLSQKPPLAALILNRQIPSSATVMRLDKVRSAPMTAQRHSPGSIHPAKSEPVGLAIVVKGNASEVVGADVDP